jgi:hypothetical protein
MRSGCAFFIRLFLRESTMEVKPPITRSSFDLDQPEASGEFHL